MLGYDPHAQVLTMDPAIDTEPLVNWNHAQMDVFCPWCLRANETNVWKRHVTYVNMLPTTAKALDAARRFADSVVASGHHVVVMEDSNHDYAVVKSNVWAYAKLVTPGSYLIVQDTRLGRYYGPSQATREWLSGPGKGSFVRDRRPEYFLFSQHAGGFLRRLTRDEQLAEWDQLA
jgi:cephalosporin hydroxylase